jgi:hypothetical protein
MSNAVRQWKYWSTHARSPYIDASGALQGILDQMANQGWEPVSCTPTAEVGEMLVLIFRHPA